MTPLSDDPSNDRDRGPGDPPARLGRHDPTGDLRRDEAVAALDDLLAEQEALARRVEAAIRAIQGG